MEPNNIGFHGRSKCFSSPSRLGFGWLGLFLLSEDRFTVFDFSAKSHEKKVLAAKNFKGTIDHCKQAKNDLKDGICKVFVAECDWALIVPQSSMMPISWQGIE